MPFLVERDGRRFWFGDFFVASALNELIPDLDELTEPGDRLVVGPADLSRTIYSDVSVYFLFPELVPATYFIEMDPGLADAEGSGLAEDIETADFLRADQHLDRMERAERVVGPSVAGGQPGRRRQLLPDRSQYEDNLVLLFERCEGGGGVSPADITGTYPRPADP